MQQHNLKTASRERLAAVLAEGLASLTEEEALAAIDNPYVTSRILQALAQNARLSAFYSVRLKLVAHRQTPQAYAMKIVHYLHWPDLVRLSVEVTVPAPVRRAIDNILLVRVEKMTTGEKVSTARRCSPALIKVFLFDPDPKIFSALLVNQRVREEDLLHFASSPQATPENLTTLAGHHKWSYRLTIRKALVLNPATPRAVAASQLRYLSSRDLVGLHQNPATSIYLRRCIEGLTKPDRSVEPVD